LTDEYARLGGFEYQSRAKGVLKGLGFEEDQFSLNVMNLSGGRKQGLPWQGFFLPNRIFFFWTSLQTTLT